MTNMAAIASAIAPAATLFIMIPMRVTAFDTVTRCSTLLWLSRITHAWTNTETMFTKPSNAAAAAAFDWTLLPPLVS